MKPDIHPPKHQVLAQCVCSNEFYFYSALDSKVIHVEVCNKCHPFYTKKQQVVATTGRVENFHSKFSHFQDQKRRVNATVSSGLSAKGTKAKTTKKNKDQDSNKSKKNNITKKDQ